MLYTVQTLTAQGYVTHSFFPRKCNAYHMVSILSSEGVECRVVLRRRRK